MLSISAEQMATLGKLAFDNYIDRLVAEAEPILARRYAGATAEAGVPTRADARQVVMAILQKAEELGIRCEGDVTSFFRMALCTTPEFRQTGLYAMAGAIVSATQFDAEKRMDAIYSLLPDSLREEIFGGGR